MFFVYEGSAKNIDKDKVWVGIILRNYWMNVSEIVGDLLIFSCQYDSRIRLR